jgi:hypothetical protein
MKKIIDHINKTLDRVKGPVSISLGALTKTQIKELEEHFEVTKDIMGYWKFKKL